MVIESISAELEAWDLYSLLTTSHTFHLSDLETGA